MIVFTDGACKGNPGPGGWGVLCRDETGVETDVWGYSKETTNNKMELIAAIEGVKTARKMGAGRFEAMILTDSQYVLKGMTEWIDGWQKRNWKTANGEEIKNVELWKELLTEVLITPVHWKWVKGHAGVKGNEAADALANRAIKTKRDGTAKREAGEGLLDK